MEDYRRYTDLLSDADIGVDSQNFGTNPSQTQLPPILESAASFKPIQKQKGKNFSEDEDRLLVSAWLNVSIDPVHGTNQTKAAFWTRVYNYYEKERNTLPEQNQNSLLHQWGTIQEAVNKFCGCIAQIESTNQSGMTIHDRIEQAERLFKAQDPNKKSFQFRHSWLQLRNQTKWHDKMQQLSAMRGSNKRQKPSQQSSPVAGDPVNVDTASPTDSSDVAEPSDIPAATDAPKMPQGKKKAREALRRGGNDGYVQALNSLWAKKKEADAEKELKKEERYAKIYALDEKRLEIEQKRLANEQEMIATEAMKVQMQKMLEEERIMNMDTAAMNEIQKQFYMSLQAEIMACRMNSN